MAVVLVEGFDYYNGAGSAGTTSVGAASRWYYNSGSLVAGRFGGQAYYQTNPNALITTGLPATYTSGCVGFAFIATGGNSSFDYCIFGVSSVLLSNSFLGRRTQFEININTSAQVEVRRGSTIVATSTTTVSYNVWNYL